MHTSKRQHPWLLVFVAASSALVATAAEWPKHLAIARRSPHREMAFVVGNIAVSNRREIARTSTPILQKPSALVSTWDCALGDAMWRSSSRGSNRNRNLPVLFSSLDDDDDDDEDENEEEIKLERRTGRIKDWMYGNSGKPMVRPIRLDGRIEAEPSPNPPRMRAKFDSLFAGMPSMDDILSGGDSDEEDFDDDEDYGERRKSNKKQVDDSWFEGEKKQILANYEDILKGILAQLKADREQDQDSVPENAEAVIKSVLKQEMDTEIKETREKRIGEMLDAYEKESRFGADAVDVSGMQPNSSVQRLIDESETEYAQLESNRLEVEDFLRYEQEAVSRATRNAAQNDSINSGVNLPAQGENLDLWALDRLKEMVGARKDSDGDEMILDILQDNIEMLESSIKNVAGRTGSRKPETMKEWQMYRSIASRMEEFKNEEGEVTKESKMAREEEIMVQLESWKDYLQKEEGIRKRSGLTRGPKLPFAWQEANLEAGNDAEPIEPIASDKQRRIEARKLLNRMSLKAMESLLEKTDATRWEKLQAEIDYLKSTLEASDYLDIDESALEDVIDVGPVDTSDLFASSVPSDDPASNERAWFTTATTQNTESYSETSVGQSKAPKTPSFEGEDKNSLPRTVLPPNTAFFADEGERSHDGSETFTRDSRLGSMEEQKLEAMYRRAGARTTEERTEIRSQWEEFQEFERGRRLLSGLSGGIEASDETGNLVGELKYNVSDVMKEGGDFDAEVILATIGPRPVRTKKSNVYNSFNRKDSPSGLDKEEVMGSLYRAVSAVGGGRYKDDPVAKAQERAAFEDFMDKENKLRESLDDYNTEEPLDLDDDFPSPTNDIEYAEEVIASLGPRPRPKRARIIDAGDYSDQGGVLASDDENDEEEDDDEDSSKEGQVGLIPEWLRIENEDAKKREGVRKSFLGRNIDEVFDDTDYEHNMRQLAEYEKRRTGHTRQIGIDISDVLGRSALDSDDYADFRFDNDYLRGRRDGWGTGSFAARKANLLDYIELDVRELNALMDHKDSIYSTGVSQYLPRVNKPFKDFGAIFRLEGVLLDVNGMQLKAWTKVAEEYGFKSPSFDDVKQAAVTRPEFAAKDIFFWTNDFLECRDIASSHRKAFKNVFNAWTKEEGIDIPVVPVTEIKKANIAMGEEVVQAKQQRWARPPSEAEKVEQIERAWILTAEEHGKYAPGRDLILIAATLSPDIAITKAFKWSSDPLEVEKIAKSFRMNMSPDFKKNEVISTTAGFPLGVTRDDNSTKPLTQTDVMELHYKAWLEVAESYRFEPPDTDEVLTAFVINEPEIAARGFGWSEDPQILSKVARDFLVKLTELKNSGHSPVGVAEPPSPLRPLSLSKLSDEGPSSDELFKIALEAWSATARSAGFPEPDNEQIQFALTVGPEDAIVTGFEWTSDPDKVVMLVKLYRDELGRRRSSSLQTVGSAKSRQILPIQSAEVTPGPSQDDLYRAVFDSWTALAIASGFPAPDDEQIQFALSVGPEEAIINGFGWTEDSSTVAQLIEKYLQEIAKRRSIWQQGSSASVLVGKEDIPMFHVAPGAAKWVKSLLDVDMQCSVVSYMEREQVDVLLEQAGLDNLFSHDKRVSSSNGYVTDKDQLLGAALLVERRPDHCVVFDSSPYASVAAHDVEMQSVNIIGPYPRYELLSADTTTASFDDLTAMNIRRLFSEHVYDQPLADVQQSDPDKRRKTKTRFYYDED